MISILQQKKLTAEIARWALAADYKRIPESVKKKIKYQILGLLGSLFGSLKTERGQRLLEYVEENGEEGEIPIPLKGKKVSLKDALFLYSSLSMLLDYDDYLFMGHTGHSSIWTSLLGGAAFSKNGKEVITGVAIGNEVGGRLGGAVLLGPQNGQMWSFIHGVNSALIYGRYKGLDFGQLLSAISHYLYQPHYPLYPGFMNSDSKIFTAARPILEGIDAANLAEAGFTGFDRIIEAGKGFLERFSIFPFDFMLTDFGEAWVTETLAVKLYPGCAYIDTTMDALSAILSSNDISPFTVKKVLVDANILTLQMNNLASQYFDPSYLSAININFNLKINIAIFLLMGSLKPEFLTHTFLQENRRKILSLAEKVEVEHSWIHTFDIFYSVMKSLEWEKLLSTISIAEAKEIRRKLEELHGYAGVDMTIGELLHLRKILPQEKRKFLHNVIMKFIKGKFKKYQGEFSLKDIDFTKFAMPFGVDVKIDIDGGETLKATKSLPDGVSYGEGFEQKVTEKFIKESAPFLSEDKRVKIVEMVKDLENNTPYNILSLLS